MRHRKFYASKLTAIQISVREDVSLFQMVERFAVGQQTVSGTYALRSDPANQIAAAAHGARKNWRRT